MAGRKADVRGIEFAGGLSVGWFTATFSILTQNPTPPNLSRDLLVAFLSPLGRVLPIAVHNSNVWLQKKILWMMY